MCHGKKENENKMITHRFNWEKIVLKLKGLIYFPNAILPHISTRITYAYLYWISCLVNMMQRKSFSFLQSRGLVNIPNICPTCNTDVRDRNLFIIPTNDSHQCIYIYTHRFLSQFHYCLSQHFTTMSSVNRNVAYIGVPLR